MTQISFSFDTFGSGSASINTRTLSDSNSAPPKRKLLKHISRDIPQANLTTRNFPLSVAELRRRSRIREGGDTYLFATTLANGQKAIILCHKA